MPGIVDAGIVKKLTTSVIRYFCGMDKQGIAAYVHSPEAAQVLWGSLGEELQDQCRNYVRNNRHFIIHVVSAFYALGKSNPAVGDYVRWLHSINFGLNY